MRQQEELVKKEQIEPLNDDQIERANQRMMNENHPICDTPIEQAFPVLLGWLSTRRHLLPKFMTESKKKKTVQVDEEPSIDKQSKEESLEYVTRNHNYLIGQQSDDKITKKKDLINDLYMSQQKTKAEVALAHTK